MKPSPGKLFRAFADETRLRILHLLAREKELCVCDLVDVLRLPQPKVSRHLSYLRGAGLVVDRKDGLWSYYALAKAGDPVHQALVTCLRGCFQGLAALRKDRATLARFNGRQGAGC